MKPSKRIKEIMTRNARKAHFLINDDNRAVHAVSAIIEWLDEQYAQEKNR